MTDELFADNSDTQDVDHLLDSEPLEYGSFFEEISNFKNFNCNKNKPIIRKDVKSGEFYYIKLITISR